MQTQTRRNLVAIGLGAVAGTALAGCDVVKSATASLGAEASKVAATIETDAARMTELYGFAKGIYQVVIAGLEVTNPAAARIASTGVALIEGLIAKGADAVLANAPTVISTTNDILLAVAPAMDAIANASTAAAAQTKAAVQ